MRQIYVEVLIRTELEQLWCRTQDPGSHERWDVRFTHIDHLPGDGEAVRFRYATRLLPGLVISGTGVTVAERRRPDGQRTSALRFASAHPLSPIREGAGYWRYVPTGAGVRFLTGYDYRPGWGGAVDSIFRPLLGWATAWSFDRLRLWLERGIDPRRALRQALAEVVARSAVTIAAFALAPRWLALAVAITAVLLPPAATTPAARRCRRRPRERLDRGPRAGARGLSASAPSILDTLGAP